MKTIFGLICILMATLIVDLCCPTPARADTCNCMETGVCTCRPGMCKCGGCLGFGTRLSDPGGDLHNFVLYNMTVRTIVKTKRVEQPVVVQGVVYQTAPVVSTVAVRAVPVYAAVVPMYRATPHVAAIRGRHWSINGDYTPSESEARNHLVRDHGYTYDQLAGLNKDTLLSMHDAAHEGGKRMFIPKASVQYVAGPCPGGFCPVNTSRKQRHAISKIYQNGVVVYSN